MKVEIGAPVVLRQDTPEVWHLPLPARKMLEHVEVTIDQGLERLSARWPTLCLHEPGEVFVYGGFVRQRRLCRGCAFVNQGREHQMPPSERAAAARHDRLVAELGYAGDEQELAA